ELLTNAFNDWAKPSAWWRMLLEALGPLLTEGADGFRVRHNDIRVFLAGRFASFPESRRKRVAAQLVDHFTRPECDRLSAHWQLFDLLKIAGRLEKAATCFTVDWVFEAAALGIEVDHLIREGESAVRALPLLRDWSQVVPVACATQSLERLRQIREYSD